MRRKGSQIADFIVSEYRRNKYWEEKSQRIKEEKSKITILDEHLREPLITEKEKESD